MQPLGRKKIQMPDAKHKPKEDGKHVAGWWENIVTPCAKRFRKQSIDDIKIQVEDFKSDNSN